MTSPEPQRCPHCQAVTEVEVSPLVRFVCTECDGIRIPIDDSAVVLSPEQVDLVRRADVARSARAIWRIIAAAGAGFGVFSVLVLWLVISVAHPISAGATMGAVAAVVPFAFAALAWKRSLDQGVLLAPLLENAWFGAATDVARARGGKVDAPALAKITRVSEDTAGQLLARMATASVLRSITSEGGLQYTLIEEPPKDNADH